MQLKICWMDMDIVCSGLLAHLEYGQKWLNDRKHWSSKVDILDLYCTCPPQLSTWEPGLLLPLHNTGLMLAGLGVNRLLCAQDGIWQHCDDLMTHH